MAKAMRISGANLDPGKVLVVETWETRNGDAPVLIDEQVLSGESDAIEVTVDSHLHVTIRERDA